jgi:hypothetical protein
MRPILVLNPRSDAAFGGYVRAQFGDQEPRDPDSLQRRLRDRFPAAVVRARILANEPATVWYVYRDGYWTSRA